MYSPLATSGAILELEFGRAVGAPRHLPLDGAIAIVGQFWLSIGASVALECHVASPEYPVQSRRVHHDYVLRGTIHEFATHYHRERNHQGLANELIERPGAQRRIGRDRTGFDDLRAKSD